MRLDATLFEPFKIYSNLPTPRLASPPATPRRPFPMAQFQGALPQNVN